MSPITSLSILLQQSILELRYRISIREFHEWHDTTLVSFSARIPTSQRGILSTAPSPQPKPGVFASHVGGGGSGDCQTLADIPCKVVGGGPVNPSGERGVDHCCG